MAAFTTAFSLIILSLVFAVKMISKKDNDDPS